MLIEGKNLLQIEIYRDLGNMAAHHKLNAHPNICKQSLDYTKGLALSKHNRLSKT
jgi:hypothetical protein